MQTQDPIRKDLTQMLPRLRRFARTLTRDIPDADDLVQTSCIRAIERSHQYDPSQPLDRWMFRLMRNVWISELRKRKVRIGTGQVEASQSPELYTEIGGAEQTYGNEIIAMIMRLPSGLASTLLLVSVEGHSYREAAEILDVPVGTIMSRMSTARQRLRQELESAAQ